MSSAIGLVFRCSWLGVLRNKACSKILSETSSQMPANTNLRENIETMADAPLVLVLCTGNSCRSHMAEGILRAAAKDKFRVASAGSKPAGYVHPLAIKALAEIGIDISAHTSKHMNDFLKEQVETVITVCGNADQACPIFSGQVNRYHWG